MPLIFLSTKKNIHIANAKSIEALIDERKRKHQQEQALLKNQIKSQKQRADMKAHDPGNFKYFLVFNCFFVYRFYIFINFFLFCD